MTQQNKILNYLRSGNTLTPLEALNMFGCFALRQRIHVLKNEMKYPIKSELITGENGKRFAQYSLPKSEQIKLF